MRGGYVLAAGALVVAVFAVGAVLAVATRSGLEAAGETRCPEGSTAGRLGETGRRACTVVNTDTREVTFGIPVRNTGRIAVTVAELPLGPLDLVGFTPETVVEGEPPFRLEPGEEREVLLRGRLPACETRTMGGATTFTDLAFRIRTLGVSRGAIVSLEPAVRLVSEPC